MYITQCPTPGFSKCMSHIFLHQDFTNVYHTLSEPGIFPNACHTMYRVVNIKCPGERHILEPRVFFLIERESILVGN